MTENNNAVDETVEDVDEGSETTDTTSTEEGNSQNESDAAGEATDKDEEAQDDEDEEPPTRKPRTNADWVALRRQQKLEKAKNAGKNEQGEADDEDSDEEDNINDEDVKLIDKVVSKRLEPFEKANQVAELKSEIDEFVAQNPDFKPYAAKALKWAQHPSWKDVPTKQIMFAAAGDKLLVMGAKRSKAATEKAAKTKTGTNNGAETGGKKPVAEMTDEEFEQEIQRVKTTPKN